MMKWRASPSGWQGYAATIATGVVATLVWSLGCTGAMWALGVDLKPVVGADLFESWSGLLIIWPVALIEELIFRVPLAIPVVLGREHFLPPLIAALSVLFGLAHGGGLPHVFIQGGAGLILSLVFLRCGGLHRHVVRGWACATASHGLFDSALWAAAFFATWADRVWWK